AVYICTNSISIIMKPVNLLSLINLKKALKFDVLKKYLKFYEIDIKESELDDLIKFVEILFHNTDLVKLYDNYYLGYIIPQISKQFDLLRIDEKTVLNIEIKHTSTPDKILNQLRRNYYYLCFLKKEIYLFTYVADENCFYTINSNQSLIKVPKN